MRTVHTIVLVSLLLLVSGCAKVNDPTDVQAIKALIDDYVKAVNTRNVDAMCAQMADNVVYADAALPAVTGKEALKKMLTGMFAQLGEFNIDFGATTADVQVSGNLGVVRGTYTGKFTHKTGLLAPVQESGNWTAVYQRQADESWKCVSDMATSDRPLPGMTADGADEKALIQIEKDMAAGMLKGDSAALDRMFAKEWTYNFAGQVQTKAQVWAEMKTAYKLTDVTIKELAPRVFGDFAIVTATGEMKGTYKGKDASGPLQGVDFFVRRGGRWQAVYTQNTPPQP